MDAGSRIAVGGYSQMKLEHIPEKQQFILSDTRSLDEFILALCKKGFLPSFCTAGYREGRTGSEFMPLAKHAAVKNFCIANGLLTFQEYFSDYASEKVRKLGRETVIPDYIKWVDENVPHLSEKLRTNIKLIEDCAKRDLRF